VPAWSRRDRDALMRIVARIRKPWHISYTGRGEVSVYLVSDVCSKHLTFQDPCESNPTGRAFTTTIAGREGGHTIDWMDGGLREYIDYLEIGVDELLTVVD
jgi:hypothetical protein